MDVTEIRSALARQIAPPPPTPLQRAIQAAQIENSVSRALLSGSAAIQTEIIVSRLSGDVASAQTNAAQVSAAYGSSVALVQDAQARSGLRISLNA